METVRTTLSPEFVVRQGGVTATSSEPRCSTLGNPELVRPVGELEPALRDNVPSRCLLPTTASLWLKSKAR